MVNIIQFQQCFVSTKNYYYIQLFVNIVKFDKILKISAKDQPDDVKRVKSMVRELLDINEELNNNIEYKSLKNIKEQLRERGPVLI